MMVTLKEWRKKKAITLEELHGLTGLSITTISRIEQGKHEARAITRKKIAKALGLEPEQIDFD
jgi:XRE family transcriptional regulator, regulator of sulfur utilization